MYDYELQNYLNQKNNKLTAEEYLYVCNTCPQLRHIKYNAFGDYFEAWSDDNNYFKFQVYRINEQ